MAKKLPEESIIYVTDMNNRPFILLKDINGELFWRPYGGEPIEQIRKFHKWELEAQEKFANDHRSNDEVDALREILMAVSLVSTYFELDEQTKNDFIAGILSKTSIDWYCSDKKIDRSKLVPDKSKLDPDEKTVEELHSYYALVAFYVNNFFNMINEVVQHTSK